MADNKEFPIGMSPDLLDAVVSAVGTLFVLLDEEGRIVRFNKACEQLTGYAFQEVQGRVVWDLLLCPEEIETAQAVFRDVRSDGRSATAESTWITKGGYRRIMWTHTALPNAEGYPACVAGIGMDMTDCHNAQQAVRQACDELERRVAELADEAAKAKDTLRNETVRRRRAEETLQAIAGTWQEIFDATQDAMFVLDMQWKILWCN